MVTRADGLYIRVTPAFYRAIEEAAKKQRVSKSTFGRRAIAKEIVRMEQQK